MSDHNFSEHIATLADCIEGIFKDIRYEADLEQHMAEYESLAHIFTGVSFLIGAKHGSEPAAAYLRCLIEQSGLALGKVEEIKQKARIVPNNPATASTQH